LAPQLLGLLDAPQPQIVVKTLKLIPALIQQLDFATIKNSLFSRIQQLYTQNNNVGVRSHVLVCIHALLKSLDHFTMVDKLIPMLKQNKIRHPAIYMALTAVLDELGREHLEKDIVARDVLPELWSIAVDTVLSVEQFKKVMRVIHELSAKIEAMHLK
jgi:SCY1-like protein 2